MIVPSMTRAHFAFIAEVIADFGYPAERQRIAEHFARNLSATNSKFKREAFLRACKGEN